MLNNETNPELQRAPHLHIAQTCRKRGDRFLVFFYITPSSDNHNGTWAQVSEMQKKAVELILTWERSTEHKIQLTEQQFKHTDTLEKKHTPASERRSDPQNQMSTGPEPLLDVQV